MKANTKQVLEWMGVSEGGYVNHPKDPGGATNFGVTQRTLDAWRKSKGLGPMSVKLMKRETADEIFIDNYFRPIWFDQLPSGLDYAMADFAVNSDPRRAITKLQKIVGAKVDGVLGVQTMASVAKWNVAELIIKLCNDRLAYMKVIKNRKTGERLWKTFGNGWTKRVMGNKLGAQTNDIGVIDRAVKLAAGRKDIPAPIGANVGKAEGKESWLVALITLIAKLFGGKK